MEKFNIEVSYQPKNRMYGALIKKGEVVIFKVHKSISRVVLLALAEYGEKLDIKPTKKSK